MSAARGQFLTFGPYALEPEAYRLWKHGQEIPLRPKTFETLHYLVANKGRTVTTEELFENIWPGTHVTNSVLTHSILEAREALSDDAKQPRYIRTIPRAGYRFIADVEQSSRLEQAKRASRILGARPWWQLTGGTLVGLLVLVVVFWLFSPSTSPDEPIDSIAVLPFLNVNGDQETESLCEGIPGSISSSLSRFSQLTVKPTSVLLRYKGAEIDPQVVCEEQGVRAVLTGRLEQHGAELVVAVELIDGRSNTLIWSQRYSRTSSDIFRLEEDIARQVANGLRLELSGEDNQLQEHSGTQDPDAYQAFLKGRLYGNLYKTRAAISWLKQAILKDPGYQEAYWELGYRYFREARKVTSSNEDYAQARVYWEKLIEIDYSTGLAYRTKGDILWMYDHRWRDAEAAYRLAVESDLNYRISMDFLQWMGRREECLARVEREIANSDPFSGFQQVMIGYRFLSYGEHDRAMEQALKALALGPQPRVGADPYYLLRAGYEEKGMEREAFEAKLSALRTRGAPEEDMSAVQEAFDKSGMEGVRRWEQVERQERSNPNLVNVAAAYARWDEQDQAFEWLANAWDLPLFGFECALSNPAFDSLRDDPRFKQLLRKLNLPEEAIQRHLTQQQ